MGEELRVKDVMRTEIVSVSPNDSVEKAARLMKENNIGSIVIVSDSKPVGIVTERDLVCRALASESSDPRMMPISKIMTRDLVTISPDDSLTDAAEKMRQYGIRRLIVVSGGKIVGIVTSKDLLQVYPDIIGILYEELSIMRGRERLRRRRRYSGICEVCGQYSDNLIEAGGLLVCPSCRET